VKKIAFALLLALLLNFNVDTAKATTYTYTADPNFPSDKIYFASFAAHGIMCQFFTPTTATLANYVYVMVDSYQRDPSKFVIDLNEKAPIPDEAPFIPGETLGTYRATTMGAKPTGYTNSLEMTKFTNSSVTEVSVDTSKQYLLCLRYSETYISNEIDGDFGWYSNPTGGYSGGYAAVMGPPLGGGERGGIPNLNYDFGFAIYNKVAQAEQPVAETPAPAATPTTTPTTTPTNATPAASTPLPAGVAAGSGAAPAAPTTSIKAPTALVVADVAADQGGSLKLDWTASTTADIDGYKVFRSTAEKTGFAEIAKTTDKTIVTYTDNTAAIGTKYYYMVRAYKTTKESASSNTVNGISVDNLAPAAPKNFTFKKNALDFSLTWDKNTEADLAGYSLTISDSSGKILETIEIAKDLDTYELIVGDHQALAVEVAYQFALVAKDTQGNISEKAVATETTVEAAAAVADTKEETNIPALWYIIGGIVVLGLAGFGVYWFKFRKVKQII